MKIRCSRPSVWLYLLVLLSAAFALAACGDDDDSGATKPASSTESVKTIEQGILTVGADIPFAPFEIGKPPDYDGFDIDLINAIADRMKLDVKVVKTPFDTAFRNLAQGQFDVVISTVTITPERQETVDFSQPYFEADQSLMVRRDSGIRSADDLEGKTVGAQLGTTGADFAKDKTPAAEVITFDLIDDAFKALETGQVDAVVNDFPVSKYAERSKPDLHVVETLKTGERYGIVVRKDNDALRAAVDRALTEVKRDGTYAQIFQDWLNTDPPKSILGAGPTPPVD
jgi:ABC-type amino acid transport substrate-binding protein